MKLTRRGVLGAAVIAAGAWGAKRWFADQGVINPCLGGDLPPHLLNHELVQKTWEGLDPGKLWDCHVHLVGVGDSDSGAWTDPKMKQLSHPWKNLQRRFYFNAACVDEDAGGVDVQYIDRMRQQVQGMSAGLNGNAKLMLMAFDWHRDEHGEPIAERSTFMMPHSWVQKTVAQYPEEFEWTASVHPYRRDAVSALREAVAGGARAVKWLPAAQGMDPASPKCDAFYDALAELKVPLIVHGGEEQAVEGAEYQELCNPLRMRRPLERGASVIVAHLASLGSSIDLDKGPNGPAVPAIDLFERIMDEPEWQGRLFGDLSAVTQRNRIKAAIPLILRRTDWGGRLLHATDYPLPGVMALFSLRWFTNQGYISDSEAKVITEVHQHNALLFDLMVKRLMSVDGKRVPNAVFQTRAVFDRNIT